MPAYRYRVCLIALLLAGTIHAQEGITRRQQGPASLLIQAAPSDGQFQLRLSDLLPIVVEIAATEVEMPAPLTRSPGWLLYKSTDAQWIGKPGGKTWRRTFWFEPLTLGDIDLHLEPWKVRVGSEWREITWDPLAVKVRTVVDELDPKKARPITSIEELPSAPDSASLSWKWIAGGAVLLFLSGWIIGRYARRVPKNPASSPRDRALSQLDRLVRRRLPEKNATAVYLRLLSLLLRSYLEKTLQLPARRWTTSELVAGLVQADHPRIAADAGAILERVDLIRFARSPVSGAECEALAERTRQLVLSHPASQPRVPVA